MLPSFIIVGAMKAGTTSLYDALCLGSPQVVPAKTKEIQYFTLNHEAGREWYENQFFDVDTRGKHVITGEASPYYLYHPLAAQRIHALLPDCKIIALLREPVARAYSQYQHFVKYDTTTMTTFARELELEKEYWQTAHFRITNNLTVKDRAHQKWSYLARSRYLEQLDRYARLFPPKNILVVNADNLFKTPEIMLPKICKFIDIAALTELPHSNKNDYPQIADSDYISLQEYFKKQNEVLEDTLGIKFANEKDLKNAPV